MSNFEELSKKLDTVIHKVDLIVNILQEWLENDQESVDSNLSQATLTDSDLSDQEPQFLFEKHDQEKRPEWLKSYTQQ